jgi:hypothetical protein
MRQLTDTTTSIPVRSTECPVFTNSATPTTRASSDAHSTTCCTVMSAREVDLFVSVSSFCFRKALPSVVNADIVLSRRRVLMMMANHGEAVDCQYRSGSPRGIHWSGNTSGQHWHRGTDIFVEGNRAQTTVRNGVQKAYIESFYPACVFRPPDDRPCFTFRVNISDGHRAHWSVDYRAGRDLTAVGGH